MLGVSHGLCLSPALLRGDQSRMHLNSARSGLRPKTPARASLRRRLSAECFEASLSLLPGSSRAPRTSEPSRSLVLGSFCASSELFFLCRGLHGALRAPSLCTTLLLLSVLVQTALSTSSAASSRCSRISPSRGLVEGLVFLRALSVGNSCARDSFVLSQRGCDVFLTSPSLHCDCFRHSLLSRRSHRKCVLRTSLAHLAVGVSRARHRLSVTFEMLDLCCCPDVMSSSSWILSFAPSMANSTLNSQFVCLSRCHHSSCLFMNCLFGQVDTVGVSARSHVNVLHWQRSWYQPP